MILAGVFGTGAAFLLWRRRARVRLLASAVTAALKSREEQARRMALIANRTDNALIVTDVQGCVEWVNAGFTRMTGYSAAEALGKELIDFLSSSEADRTALAVLRARLVERAGFKSEVSVRTRSGERYHVALEVQPIGEDGGGFVAVASDITRRIRAEQELRAAHDELEARVEDRTRALARANAVLQSEVAERVRVEAALRVSEERLRSVLDNTTSVVYAKDLDGRYLLVNARFETLSGLSRQDMVGKTDRDVFPPTIADAFLENDRRVLEAAAPLEFEEVARLPDGDRTYLSVKFPLYGASGDICAICGISTDITERKRSEKQLEQARSAAETATRAKSEFLANMSHEIRTPMTAILGYADLLLEPGQSDSDRLDRVQTIRRNGEHLLSIINDILDLSKIEAGEMKVERIACSPHHVVSDVASLLRVGAAEKNLNFDVRYLGPVPAVIQTDPTRLRQILLNLAGNAIKFTETGRVELAVAMGDATLGGAPRVRFAVTDTGIGLDPAQVSRLFRPFSQADTSTTRRFGGTGLGLTISKYLAGILGGDIEVSSTPGQGSTFVLHIETGPLQGVLMQHGLAEAVTAREESQPVGNSRPFSGKILLAEDGADNRQLLSHHLRKAGLTVAVAENGRIAFDQVAGAAASGAPFDLVLMDMQMPELDGYGAAALLRAKGYTCPIIALTAHAMADDRDKCLRAGCTDYLSKPTSKEKLLAAVARHLPAEHPPAASDAGAAITSDADRSSDVVSLRSTLADDPDTAPFLPAFVDSLPEQIGQLAAVARKADLAALAAAVHGLKGTGGLFGFPALTELAGGVEQELDAGATVESLARQIDDLIRLARSIDGYDAAREAAAATEPALKRKRQ